MTDTLGMALASIASTTDPEMFMVGGGVARAGDVLFNPYGSISRPMPSVPAARPPSLPLPSAMMPASMVLCGSSWENDGADRMPVGCSAG